MNAQESHLDQWQEFSSH